MGVIFGKLDFIGWFVVVVAQHSFSPDICKLTSAQWEHQKGQALIVWLIHSSGKKKNI